MSEQKTAGRAESVVVWFEIPANDFDRATGFYERILGVELKREAMGPMQLGVFPYERPGISGAVMKGEQYKPATSATGPVLYLNCDGKLDAVLARIEGAGGKIAQPRVDLPPGMGSYAHIIDSEGNRVGLHAAS